MEMLCLPSSASNATSEIFRARQARGLRMLLPTTLRLKKSVPDCLREPLPILLQSSGRLPITERFRYLFVNAISSDYAGQSRLEAAFRMATERYAEFDVNVTQRLARLAKVSLSLHCWQGDD